MWHWTGTCCWNMVCTWEISCFSVFRITETWPLSFMFQIIYFFFPVKHQCNCASNNNNKPVLSYHHTDSRETSHGDNENTAPSNKLDYRLDCKYFNINIFIDFQCGISFKIQQFSLWHHEYVVYMYLCEEQVDYQKLLNLERKIFNGNQ